MYQSQIVISALGQDKPGIVNALSKSVLDCGGNIAESRMTRLGDEFALIMLVEGVEDSISTVEKTMQDMNAADALTIITKRTVLKVSQEQCMPYHVNVICMDQPGIVHDITDFIARKKINIEELETSNYAAAHTGTQMFALDMSISIPSSINTSQFKQDILAFCDELNLDAAVEPIK